jgi:O-antigen/teichoic acid export membrane protein
MMKKIRDFLLINSSTGQTIAKNTFWLFFGQIISRLIRVVIVIYGARILGVADWGAFSYALALAAFFTVFLDFGINAVITRESVHDLKKQEEYFATSLVIKFISLAVLAVLIIAFAPDVVSWFTKGVDTQKVISLIPFVILIMGFDGLRDFAATLSRAWEKMEVESLVQIVTNAVIVAASFIALGISVSPQSLGIGYTVGTGVGMLMAFYPFRHYLRDIFKKIKPALLKPILFAAWPFGMLGIVGIINLNTDIIMLGWYRTLETVGYYSSAQKIAQLVQSVPGLIAIAFFPALVKALHTDRFKALFEKATRVLLVLVVPITIVSFVYAEKIVLLLFGEQYLSSSRTFQIMSFTFITAFFAASFGNALFALGKEKKLLAYVGTGIVANILFNFLLIPRYGSSGAALSTVLVSFMSVAYLYIVLYKELHFSIFQKTGKIILSAAAMFLAAYACSIAGLHVVFGALVSSGLYAGMLLWLREETLRDVGRIAKQTISGNTAPPLQEPSEK